MSKPSKMVDCPQCSHRDLEEPRGTVRRYIQGTTKFVRDICNKCGGSGRIIEYNPKMFDRTTILLKKKQKAVMREWIESEKELVFGEKKDG